MNMAERESDEVSNATIPRGRADEKSKSHKKSITLVIAGAMQEQRKKEDLTRREATNAFQCS
jgi:hypothetical protein